MKKGRPGIVLSALARPGAERDVALAILEETTALGVRVSRLDRYELLCPVGEGGMAYVYRAKDRESGRSVAV